MQNNRNAVNKVTEGRLIVGLLHLSVPMLISGILQNVQSLIDLFWVGRLGSISIAAISLSGSVMMLTFPVIMGLATGVVAIVSRSVGAGLHDKAAEASAQALLTGLTFGAMAAAAGYAAAKYILELLGGEPAVVQVGIGYLRITFLGLVPIFLFFMASSILQASGNTVTPMISMLCANVLNMILDPILIFGLLGFPRLEVRGAALATVISQTLAALIICTLLFHKKSKRFSIRREHFSPRPKVLGSLIKIGLPSSGQLLTRSLMALVLMRIVAGLGTSAVAAYGIGMRLHMTALMPAFALGGAAATMMGQNLGANNPARAVRSSWLATGVCVSIMILVAAILVPFANEIASLFTSSGEVVAISASYFRIVTPFYIFVAFSIVLGRALNGAGDTVSPMITTIIALWALQVPLAIILPNFMTPPTHGIWFAIGLAITMHGAMNTAWFMSGKWRNKKV